MKELKERGVAKIVQERGRTQKKKEEVPDKNGREQGRKSR